MEQGTVRMVNTIEAGCIITDHIEHELGSPNAGDIDPDGGILTPDGGTTLLPYTGVEIMSFDEPTDEDPDATDDHWIIALDEGAPIDKVTWDESGETWMQQWPASIELIADVTLSDGTDAQVLVPHSLRAVMGTGVREEGRGETVVFDLVDGRWTIVDILGRKATIVGSAIDEQTKIEIASASGATRNTYATTGPRGLGKNVGDAWFWLYDGHTVGMWHWNGHRWDEDVIDGTAIANLDAGTIVSGSLSGIDIYSPSPEETPRVHIGSSTLQVVRSDGEDGEMATITLGGPTDDQMMLYGVNGEPAAGFTADGGGVAKTMDVADTLTVGGQDLTDLLGQLPRGVIAHRRLWANSPLSDFQFGDNETGVYELAADMEAGRLYRFGMAAHIGMSRAAPIVLRLRMESAEQTGDEEPAQVANPTITSFPLDTATFQLPGGNSYLTWTPIINPGPVNTACRLLVTIQTASSGAWGSLPTHESRTTHFWVEDLGQHKSSEDGQVNFGGATPRQGHEPRPSDTSTPVASYTKIWYPSQMRCWSGDHMVNNFLQQGFYNGESRYSLLMWPAGLVQELEGATIQNMQVYLKNEQFYGGSGRAAIGQYRKPALPDRPQTSGGAAFFSRLWAAGAGKWVNLPHSWWEPIARGEIHGFTLGEGYGGTTNGIFGKFKFDKYACMLRATYTK